MTISILQSALSLAEFTPKLAKLLSNTRAEPISKIALDIAKSITKTDSDSLAIEKLKLDKNMFETFQRTLSDSEKEIELASIRDRENARSRDIAIINTGRRNKRADIMVISAALGLIVCLGSICIYQQELPGEVVGIVSTIAGIFGSCLKDAYNFEFGSSRGSKEKDHSIASLLKK
ncbi:MAG: hypothetical protein IJ481_03425 [Alphaproteobacteria bacterium]|nr:hypothetical protein [Alphaproteobacteria bacterium]